MATSGARLQLALAPAGTGKTTAMAAVAAAWRNSGGTVIGLAPTAGAAEVLAQDLASPTDTIAKLNQLTDTSTATPAPADDPARRWFDRISSDTLLIVDEAGMASTADLDTLIAHALARGASVRLIGDDQQLASVSAGGVLRDLAERHDTVTLSTVVRFTHPETGKAEAAASLAIRAGDPAGIGFYIDHHRVHVGADQTAADMAFQAWAADRAAGRDSILLAPTNDLVAQLNERARLDRLTHTPTIPASPPNDPQSAATVTLADGLTASAGDWIATRKNARWLRTTTHGAWVKNGHRWIIRAVHDDGSITVVPLRGPATPVRLPARYVTTYTTLGYASTINAAQGMTAGHRDTEGTCHIVGSDRLTRQQLYVAATRGCTENHLYFSTAEADPHRILTPKATHPPTAVDILTTILGRDGAQHSAHSIAAADTDPFNRLHLAADMYSDALSAAAEHHAGPDVMARIDTAAARLGHHLTDAQAWPVLRRHLALLAIEGHDPIDALHQAAATGLGDAHDPAAVLDWRLPTPTGSSAADRGPLHWLPAIPDVITTDPTWATYLRQRAELVSDLADHIRGTARAWDAATAPAWARPLLDGNRNLLAEIAVFRAAHRVEAADTRITGPEQHANRSAMVQQAIHSRLDAALTRAGADTARWRQLARTIDPHLTDDPYWPRLATPSRRRRPRRRRRAACSTRPRPNTGRSPLKCPLLPCGGGWPAPWRPPPWRAATPTCGPPGPPTCTTSWAPASPKPSSPTPPGPASSPRSPPPTGPPTICSPRPLNTCTTSQPPRPSGPTNTPACSPTASNCSPTTPPPSTPTSPIPPNRPKHPPANSNSTSTTTTSTPTYTSPRPTPTTTPTASSKTTSAASTSTTCPPCVPPCPPASTTSTFPPYAPAATPPTVTPTNSPTPSSPVAADPPNTPPRPNWPSCTAAWVNNAPASRPWPALTTAGSTPKTPPNCTANYSPNLPPRSPRPPSAASTTPPSATANTTRRSANKPTGSTPRCAAPATVSTLPAPHS
ncbi:AAA family ATPase [Mycobacterium interjectum]|uniref:AAA family ATPase n=1 Tax=Mycobacterium interjectum TaxID=33895 RepID=UPI0021F25EA5|nr:AAA family ATPase [Mycobacterium interjectum]